jgi:hypothetical protein
MQEKTIVKAILAYLKSIPDCFAWKEHGGMYGQSGLPDIICCCRGRFIGLEVKIETGKATTLQTATLRKIQNAGGTAHLVRSVDDVKEILATLQK